MPYLCAISIALAIVLQSVFVAAQGTPTSGQPASQPETLPPVVISAASRTLQLRTIYRDPGHYTADLIPTAPGQYRFRFLGSIKELAIQETFDSKSGGGQFDDIASSVDLQFPVRLPEIREIANAVRGTQQSAQQAQHVALKAQQSCASTRFLALVGVALGVLGTATGISALVVVYRKR